VVKSGAREWQTFPVSHAAPVMMSPMSYQGMKRTHDNHIMALAMMVTTKNRFKC